MKNLSLVILLTLISAPSFAAELSCADQAIAMARTIHTLEDPSINFTNTVFIEIASSEDEDGYQTFDIKRVIRATGVSPATPDRLMMEPGSKATATTPASKCNLISFSMPAAG